VRLPELFRFNSFREFRELFRAEIRRGRRWD
jgi:hypothetical protein